MYFWGQRLACLQTVLKWLSESSEDIVVDDNVSVPGRLPMPYLFARVADNSKARNN